MKSLSITIQNSKIIFHTKIVEINRRIFTIHNNNIYECTVSIIFFLSAQNRLKLIICIFHTSKFFHVILCLVTNWCSTQYSNIFMLSVVFCHLFDTKNEILHRIIVSLFNFHHGLTSELTNQYYSVSNIILSVIAFR